MESYARGRVTGTGAAIEIPLGFTPDKILLTCPQEGTRGVWHDFMDDASLRILEDPANDYSLFKCALSIGTTSDKELKVGKAYGVFQEVRKHKASAEVAFTATTHDVATGSKWASYRISMQVDGTVTITISASNDYATEALAIAALAATPSDEISLGYITIQSQSGSAWDATGHSLAGGASTPADATNYYAGEPSNIITSGGITPVDRSSDDFTGFTIGTSALFNVAGKYLEWEAFRGIVDNTTT